MSVFSSCCGKAKVRAFFHVPRGNCLMRRDSEPILLMFRDNEEFKHGNWESYSLIMYLVSASLSSGICDRSTDLLHGSHVGAAFPRCATVATSFVAYIKSYHGSVSNYPHRLLMATSKSYQEAFCEQRLLIRSLLHRARRRTWVEARGRFGNRDDR